MKIKIIYPTRLNKNGVPIKTKARQGKISNLLWMYLAGLTPREHEIDIIDDIFEDVNFDEPVDLVALTAMTSQAPRAYQIAGEYRKRGVKVVIGGFHASLMTDEAINQVDAVVVGEAESVWLDVLEDARNNRLKKIYRGELLKSLAGLPAPRYDLLASKNYRYNYIPVWVGRGCPHNCVYCTVKEFYGATVRNRPVEDIIRDVSLVPRKRVMFIDDNLFAYKKLLVDLFPRLKPFHIKWLAQIDPKLADDDKLLDMAQEAGLETVYIGFESFVENDLATINKKWAYMDKYERLVEKLHRRGIIVFASLIFGIGKESPQTAAETLERLEKWKVDELALYILTPAPGSVFWNELVQKNVSLSRDWSLYDGANAVFMPENMTIEEFERLYWSLYQGFYSPRSMMKRFFRFPRNLRNWLLPILRNLLVFRQDVNSMRSVHSNFFSLMDLIPGYSSVKKSH